MQETFHKANKNLLGDWVVQTFLMRRPLRRAFTGVYLCIDHETRRICRQATVPVIFCATHSGWWDGHMASVLNGKVFRLDAYLMMEEVNLKRYPFFTWAGVFGVDREDPRSAIASIEYIVGVLKERPGRAVWIYPQGTMHHADERPLIVYSGAANIARRLGRCLIVPVALRYDFFLEQAPYALAWVGRPIQVDGRGAGANSKELTARLTSALTYAADCLREDVISHNLDGYSRIMEGRGSVNNVWDGVLRVAGWARSVITGRLPGRERRA